MCTNQQDLSSTIKSVHAKLRQRCREGANPEAVWAEHTTDKKTLSRYAEAMQTLATEYWHKSCNETRIAWCYSYLLSYFSQNGHLQKIIDKETRTKEFHNKYFTSQETCNDEKLQCCGKLFNSKDELKFHCTEINDEISVRENATVGIIRMLPLLSGIRILDVGSCYAPFNKYKEFDCLSIDLYPANECVHKCDFINVDVSSGISPVIVPETDHLEDKPKQVIQSLPSNFFCVVIFSLLLEYIPTAQQRWKCCIKAHQVLQTNGVLLVITPDSSKQHRNAKQMKDWKIAIESIGFQRCFYEKKTHMHCLAFRKTADRRDVHEIVDRSSDLYIPQDFNAQGNVSDSDDELEPTPKRSKDDH